MQKLSALIVDDEHKAVELLEKLLEDTHQFSTIQATTSAVQAKEILKNYEPDLLFLDIKMPEMDGFAFLEELKHNNKHIEVVFVTAYDQYALKALKNHAFDYLIKPIDRKELLDCIMQFKERKQDPDLVERLEKLVHEHKDNHRLRINTRTGYIFIEPAQILYCQADGNYTLIDLGERQHLCSLQLGALEELLPKNDFLRLGRSLIVNFNLINKVDRKTSQITFEKGNKQFTLPISKTQVKELEARQTR
jgi:two-component system, LytTR family, response regulator